MGLLWLLVFNTTFNNISAISWWSILLVEETEVPRKNHRPVASYCQTLSHNVVSSTHPHERVRTHNFSGDCIQLPHNHGHDDPLKIWFSLLSTTHILLLILSFHEFSSHLLHLLIPAKNINYCKYSFNAYNGFLKLI